MGKVFCKFKNGSQTFRTPKSPQHNIILTSDGSCISNVIHLMEGTVRDMRRSFRDIRNLRQRTNVIQTRATEKSTATSPVPFLFPSKPAQLTILESTSSSVDWRVLHELDRLAMPLLCLPPPCRARGAAWCEPVVW